MEICLPRILDTIYFFNLVLSLMLPSPPPHHVLYSSPCCVCSYNDLFNFYHPSCCHFHVLVRDLSLSTFYTVALVIIIILPLFQKSSQITFHFSLIFSDLLCNPIRAHPVLVSFLLFSINRPVTCGISLDLISVVVHDSLS
jgi:hypothetical protein